MKIPDRVGDDEERENVIAGTDRQYNNDKK
jgi:hypothetical protein